MINSKKYLKPYLNAFKSWKHESSIRYIEWNRFKSTYLYWIINITFIVFIFLTMNALFSIYQSADIIEELNLNAQLNEKYVKLFLLIGLSQVGIFYIHLLFVVLFLVISYLLFQFIKLFVDFFYKIYTLEDNKYSKIRTKIYKVLEGDIKPRLNILSFFLIFGSLFFFDLSNFNIFSKKMIEELIDYIIIMTFIIYLFIWINYYLIILKKRKQNKSNNYLSIYFFSKYSLRKRLVNIIIVIIFFATIATVLVPTLLLSMNYISELIYHSIDNYYSSTYLNLIKAIDETNNLFLPYPDKLLDFLSFGKQHLNLKSLIPYMILFQQKIFIIVTIVTLLEIGLPSLISILLKPDRLQVYISLFKATLISTILILLLQFFINYAYFLNTNEIFSSTTLFLFIISFFLMQESSTKLYK